MNIVLYGATGNIGRRVAREALDRGHSVTGISRHPERAQITHPRYVSRKGDVTDAALVAGAVKGHDVVISAIGPEPGKDPDAVIVEAARALPEGLARAGVKRLIVVGGAGSLEVAPGKMLMDTPDFPSSWKSVARAAFDALTIYRENKSLDWTYVSPAALIEPGTRTGKYRTGAEQLLTDSAGTSRISMEDFAVALLDEAEKPRHVRRRLALAY